MDVTWLLGVVSALATVITALAGYIARIQVAALAELKRDFAERLAAKDKEIAQLHADGRLKDDRIEALLVDQGKTFGALKKWEGRFEEAAKHNVSRSGRERGASQ